MAQFCGVKFYAQIEEILKKNDHSFIYKYFVNKVVIIIVILNMAALFLLAPYGYLGQPVLSLSP